MGDGKKGGKFEFQLIARKRRFVALFYVFLKSLSLLTVLFLFGSDSFRSYKAEEFE